MGSESENNDADGENAGKKKNAKKVALGDMGQEVLSGVMEQMKVKCITEMLVTQEGRDLLEKCTGEGKPKILEAHQRAAQIMEEMEALKRQMEELQDQIEAVGAKTGRE